MNKIKLILLELLFFIAEVIIDADLTFAGDATLANQTTILTRIGTNADAAGTSTLFARLASIDTTKIGTSSDTGASATLFGKIGSNTDSGQCTLTGCSNETVFGIIRNLAGRTRNSLSQFGGDGSESTSGVCGTTGAIYIAPGIHQYAGGCSVGNGSTATSIHPSNSAKGNNGGLFVYFKGSLTITDNAKIDVTGYGAKGGNTLCGADANPGDGGGPDASNGSGNSGGLGSTNSLAGAGGGGGSYGYSGGGAGGGGGNGGYGHTLASGDTGTATPGLNHSILLAARANLLRSYGGGGGGGGSSGGSYAGGGGGGGGGGVIWLRTHTFTNNGTINVNGGTGGPAGDTSAVANTSGEPGFGGNGGLAPNGGANAGSCGSPIPGGGGGTGGGALFIEADSVTINSSGGLYARGANGGKGGNITSAFSSSNPGGTGANGFTFVEIVP